MADNYINVTVTSKQNKRVTVSTQDPGYEVTATTDTGKFWAKTAEKWATSDTIVENKDYSSKYYANKAKASEENARVYENTVKDTYNTFIAESGNITDEVRNAGQESVNSIESSRVDAVDSINTVKNTAVDSINATKTNILKDIEFVADGEKEEIQELADNAIEEINSSGINSRANLDLSNLSAAGENKFNTILNNKITNCLLEVPQNIKLELNNGTLTLKAGSIVTVPNGFEADGVTKKFDYVTIESDVTGGFTGYTFTGTACYNTNNTIIIDGVTATAPVTSDNYLYYDTTKNLVQRIDASGVISGYEKLSFPIGIVSMDSTIGVKSIDQVFNGMGYIGSTVWIDKGVKGLIPNGRNEDGSLNSIEVVTDRLILQTNPFGASDSGMANLTIDLTNNSIGFRVVFRYIESVLEPTTTYTTWYNPDTNLLKYTGATAKAWIVRTMTPVCSVHYDFDSSTRVNTFTSLTPKQPFRAVDYNDAVLKSNVVNYIAVDWSKRVNKTVSTTYTAESNGYVIASGSPSGNNSLKCTVNGNVIMNLNMHGLSGASYDQGFTIPVSKDDKYSVVGANEYYFFLPFKEV